MARVLGPGTSLGGLKIVDLLGQGAMGAVYRGVGPTGALVAIKVIVGEAAEDLVYRERFRREAEAASRVHDPGVVRCVGSGEDLGTLWIAFELVEGGSLAHRLREGSIPWREAAALGAGIARALAAVHAAGVVHRDLKPANILLDTTGRPKLTDFGIARRTDTGGRSLTKTGEVIGTPEYLAPEQCEEAKRADFRADLYSLGGVLHTLVSGTPPFTGPNALAVITGHISKAPTPLRSLVLEVPPALDALVLRLLSKDPARRGESATSVARELEAIARGETGVERRLGWLVLGAVLVATPLVVAGLSATRMAPPPPAQPPSRPAPPPPRSRPAPPEVPDWYRRQPPKDRPRLPLPDAVRFRNEPHEYVAAVDSSLVLVYVPGGRFVMGDDDSQRENERPAHPVELSPFFIGKYEVTIGQFRRYVKQLPGPLPRAPFGYFDRSPGEKSRPYREQLHTRTWLTPILKDDEYGEAEMAVLADDLHPVSEVTADNAADYARFVRLELPTEAQWELAGTWPPGPGPKRRFAWGDTLPGGGRDSRLANLIDISLSRWRKQSVIFGTYDDGAVCAARVGSFPRDRSTLGVYDLTGNVREICRDRYDSTFYARSPTKDPCCEKGEDGEDLRVIRGGSWGQHEPTLSLCSRDPCRYATNVVGFRVALTVREGP